jgi:hypothetical protein
LGLIKIAFLHICSKCLTFGFSSSNSSLLTFLHTDLHQGSNQNLDDKYPAGNDRLAVVPYVPPAAAAAMATYWSSSPQNQNPVVIEELMKSEESNSMEVDEPVEPHHTIFGGNGGSEGFHQQWQLHCMTPGTQPNPTTHLMWSQ